MVPGAWKEGKRPNNAPFKALTASMRMSVHWRGHRSHSHGSAYQIWPLSTPFRPALWPLSLMRTPGISLPSASLNLTTNT